MADPKTSPLVPEAHGEPIVSKTPSRMASTRVTESSARALLSAVNEGIEVEWTPPTMEELQFVLPKFEFLSFVARGGMGAIYKARQLELQRFVAIKVLPPEGNKRGLDYAGRFKQEARAMAQFNHPGIVPVYDAGETWDGLLYFVMEFVEGENVAQMIKARGKLPPQEAARIIASVCEALAYAHSHDVVHRDMTPANVIVSPEGLVKIADFGLAKLPPAVSATVTSADVTIGTQGFMAPEAFIPGGLVDHRADIYGVGAMLYQMLTGIIPRGVFEMPSKLVPGLDERFDRIVDRAMKSDRVARYASVVDLRSEILPLVSGEVSAPRRRGTAPWIGVSIAAAIAISGLAWSSRAKVEPNPAPTAFTERLRIFGRALAEASREKPYVNTLGMEFVPVPGTTVLFSRWETREADYAACAAENPVNEGWKTFQKSGIAIAHDPRNPVAGVSWDDAIAFCEWLTEKELQADRLPPGMRYRLATDEEWSRAVGLPRESGATPKDRDGKDDTHFPWGGSFPPPDARAGNYGDAIFHEKFPEEKWVEGYDDGFVTAAPAGSFAPNAHGLHDMGGGVWEWCEDLYDRDGNERVLRGGAWDTGERAFMLSSARLHVSPRSRDGYGFRCVLAFPVVGWAKAFPNPEKIAGIFQIDNGWMRCKPTNPGLLVPFGKRGNLVLRNGGVRARFRGHFAALPWAKLEIRKGDAIATPALRYIPPAKEGEAAEMRIELTIQKGKQFATLASAPAEMRLEDAQEYTMELCAVGNVLIGRINRQTLIARWDKDSAPVPGGLGIWGVDRNFFRDIEVINLDSLPEAEALKILGADPK